MHNLFLLLICCGMLVACRKEENGKTREVARRGVLVWLAGDNDLSSEVTRKITALTEGFRNAEAGTDARLMVYADCRNAYPRLLEITAAGDTVVESYPAQNSASGQTLNRMLSRMMELCPAEKYGLIVFSHATGWLPEGALENPALEGDVVPDLSSRTILADNETRMDMAEFARSLPLSPSGSKYDYIVFETCLMAGVEVAYELRDKADRLLVSAAEILSPGFEEVYPSALSYLLQPEADLCGFARDYFDCWNRKEGAYRSATVSVIRTGGMERLAEATREVLSAAPSAVPEGLTRMQRFNRHAYTLFFDLLEYAETIAPEHADKVRTALSSVVEYAAATPDFMKDYPHGFTISHHCGLTTYIPQTNYPALNAYYRKLAWRKAVKP